MSLAAAIIFAAAPGASAAFTRGDVLSAGGRGTCVVLDDISVKCWGDNLRGGAGIGLPSGGDYNVGDDANEMQSLVGINLGPTVQSVHRGDYHTCVLFTDGTVKCWGYNDGGQLGTETDRNVNQGVATAAPVLDLGSDRTVTVLSAGSSHNCAVLDNGSVKCWGNNYSGMLGYDDTTRRGDSSGSMGDNLPAVNLGAGNTAVSVACGVSHTCAILQDGKVKCWGSAEDAKLGIATGNYDNDRQNEGDQTGEMANLGTADLGAGRAAKQLALGEKHTCALLDDGTVKCWGNNRAGQGGQVTTGDWPGYAPNSMGDNLATVDLGTGRTAKQIGAGSMFTCALLDDNTVKCWGKHQYGELGLQNNNADYVGNDADEMGDNLDIIDLGTGRTAKSIALGSSHVCAVLDDDSVKCWGQSYYGQTGQNSDDWNLGRAPDTMGDNLDPVFLGTSRTVMPMTLCAEDEHVDSGSCASCSTGTSRAAFDDPSAGDTSCAAPPSAPGANPPAGATPPGGGATPPAGGAAPPSDATPPADANPPAGTNRTTLAADDSAATTPGRGAVGVAAFAAAAAALAATVGAF